MGTHGGGVKSIMPKWVERGIVVQILGLTGKWEDCQMLTILASTRVRISYPNHGTYTTYELVFPPDPDEASIRVYYLSM